VSSASFSPGAVRTHGGDLRVVEEAPSCAFAFRRDLALFLWGRGITTDQARGWGHAAAREMARSPKVVTLVWLTGLPASSPSDEVRAVIARTIASAPPTFVALHYVVEAEGFGSAIARSVITGLNLKAKATLKVEVHDEIAQAIPSIARTLSWSRAESDAVTAGLGSLRADWARRGGVPLPAAPTSTR
jgi:hypothetical protein